MKSFTDAKGYRWTPYEVHWEKDNHRYCAKIMATSRYHAGVLRIDMMENEWPRDLIIGEIKCEAL